MINVLEFAYGLMFLAPVVAVTLAPILVVWALCRRIAVRRSVRESVYYAVVSFFFFAVPLGWLYSRIPDVKGLALWQNGVSALYGAGAFLALVAVVWLNVSRRQ